MKPPLKRNLEHRSLHKFAANLRSRQKRVCTFNPKNDYNLPLWELLKGQPWEVLGFQGFRGYFVRLPPRTYTFLLPWI